MASADEFIQMYRENPVYQQWTDRVWGRRMYDSRPRVAIDAKTEAGIRSSYNGTARPRKCIGKQEWTGSSRHNAKDAGVRCCSKWQNGQMADDVKATGIKNGEDCGYGWSGNPVRMDATELVMPPPPPPPGKAWIEEFRTFDDKHGTVSYYHPEVGDRKESSLVVFVPHEADKSRADESCAGGSCAQESPAKEIALMNGPDFIELNLADKIQQFGLLYWTLCGVIPAEARRYNTDGTVAGVYREHSSWGDCIRCRTILDRYQNHPPENPSPRFLEILDRIYYDLHRQVEKKQTINVKKFKDTFLRLCNQLENELKGGKIQKTRKTRKTRKIRKTRKN
jgi:hypothetical protein